METANPTVYLNLADEAPIPKGGILSRTLSKGGGLEFVLFAFAAGEALSEHTAARPAIIHILSGEGDLRVAGDDYAARAGTWVRMPAHCPHSITASTPLMMGLYLLPAEEHPQPAV